MHFFVITLLAVLPMLATVLVLRSVKASHAKYKNPLTKSLRRPRGLSSAGNLGPSNWKRGSVRRRRYCQESCRSLSSLPYSQWNR